MDNPEISQTDWNGGTFLNMRLHQIEQFLIQCSLSNDIYGWISGLIAKNHQIYGFESPEEKIQIHQQLTKLNEEINEYKKSCYKVRNKFNKGIPNKFIDELNRLQYKLDEIHHKSGLQTALRDDAGDAF